MAIRRSPKEFSDKELAEVGVTIVDKSRVTLQCKVCGQKWYPAVREGGRLPSGYWKCPSGCNGWCQRA